LFSYWVSSVAYSPDGKHIVSGSYDNTVRIWGAATGEEVSHRALTFVFAAACTGADLWGRVDEQKCTLRGHSDWVRSVAYSQDGKLIVSGSHDRTVRIWDAATGEEVSVWFL
jgi:WD40 repeat protein